MIKFIRKYSRAFAIVLALFIKIVVILGIIIAVGLKYLAAQILFEVLKSVVLIIIINKNMPPSHKLPWCIIVACLPFVGTMLYIMIGNPRISRKQKKYLLEYNLANFNRNIDFDNKLNLDEIAASQVKYLEKTNFKVPYQHCQTNYYKTGEDFLMSLLRELRNAKKYIMMEYFIIEEGVMWNQIYEILQDKVKDGIDVFVMYDDLGTLTTLSSVYADKMRKNGIRSARFNLFAPIIWNGQNHRDHRKITVIDGHVGFIGGINIADEYINVKKPYGDDWKDSAVMIKGKAVDDLVYTFLGLFNIAKRAQLNYKDKSHKIIYEPLDFIELIHNEYDESGIIVPFETGPSPLYVDNIAKGLYLTMFGQARKTIDITTPYLICDWDLLDALKNAAKRGVLVRIILPFHADKKIIKIMSKSNYLSLIESGVEIYEYVKGFIHAKNVLVDDTYAVCGTINLDYRSLVHHYECGVWQYMTNSVQQMKDDFNNMYLNEVVYISKSDARLSRFERLVKTFLNLFAPLL